MFTIYSAYTDREDPETLAVVPDEREVLWQGTDHDEAAKIWQQGGWWVTDGRPATPDEVAAGDGEWRTAVAFAQEPQT